MNCVARIAIATGVTFLSMAVPSSARDATTLEIGDPAPNFNLPGVDGEPHQLGDYADAKILAIIFTCNHCPTAQAYEERIVQLYADYKDRGVALVAISPNAPQAVRLDELGYTDVGDSLEDMKVRANMRNFEFPYLYDGDTQDVAAAYGALATPHLFLFDRNRRLRYAGRIDDSDVGEVKSHDARNAIEAILNDRPVPVEKTKVFGCSVKWAEKESDAVTSIEKWNKEEVTLKLIDVEQLRTLAKNDTDKYRLVNVWATWCGPCVEELPYFVEMNRMYRKRPFELITVSADAPEQRDDALEQLKELHVSSRNYLFDSDDPYALEALDSKWPGPLPHTVFIAPGGKVVFRKNGPIDPAELKRVIADTLGRTYKR